MDSSRPDKAKDESGREEHGEQMKAGGGGGAATAGEGIQDGDKENKAGCEGDAEKADPLQRTADTSTANEDESDKSGAETLTVDAAPAAGGDIGAVAGTITQHQEEEAVEGNSKDLPKETMDEVDKGATEATAMGDAAAEGGSREAKTETQQSNKGVQSTSDRPSSETPTVKAETARDKDSPKTNLEGDAGLEGEIHETEEQDREQGQEDRTRTEEDQAEQTPPSTTKPPLHLGLVIGAILFAVLAAILFQWLRPVAEPKRPNLGRVEVLKEEMVKVEQSFRSQRTELWRRSRIHLQRHLKSPQPSEPVSLILVGGQRAERTLGCLASRLAKAFSLALNGSVLQVDGASLANTDHDQVKLDLDNQLKEAFEDDKPAAVIHRLEELPPSSTLIFYRYCDHENAAYKHPLLAFTVLLPQDAVGPEFSISQVEEMAHSHIHQKFLTPDQPDTFDKMDVDKLSGLWSRISHLILPVNMEEHMEKEGCDRN